MGGTGEGKKGGVWMGGGVGIFAVVKGWERASEVGGGRREKEGGGRGKEGNGLERNAG